MQGSFFEEFLYLTEVKTLIFIAVLLVLFYVIRRMEKRKVNFSMRMLIATGLGLILGLSIQLVGGFPDAPLEVRFISEVNTWYGLISTGFMSLLRMLVIPLIFVSIIRVIINMENSANLGKLTARTIGTLIGTTVIATIIAIIVGQLFRLGVGSNLVEGEAEIREISTLASTVLGLIPANPIEAMVNNNVIAIVIFSAFLGVATKRQTKKHYDVVKPFINLVEAFYKVILSVAMTIIKWMPYAVIALFANTVAGRGVSALAEVATFIVATYVSIAIMFLIHLIIISINGLNPIQYLKNVLDVLVLAFTSRSSLGTLPVTIEKLTTEVGVNQGTATFVGTLATNGGMNGCAGIFPALAAVMLANMTGTPINFTFIVMLMIVIAFGSFGIAGLPGTATMALSVTLAGMGLGEFFPLLAGVVAIDPILDMGRTMLNVNGALTTAVVVDKSLGQLDEEVYYGRKKVELELEA